MAIRRDKKQLLEAIGWALALVLALPAHAEERTLDLGDGKTLHYEVLDPSEASASARGAALAILRHLAEGNIHEAAALSNAPARREEVLRDYQARVGEEEFKRVFARYLARADTVVAEVAIGAHHLIIWQLPGSGAQLAGQFYVQADGRFLLDDVPSETRSNLRRVLQAYRREASPAK